MRITYGMLYVGIASSFKSGMLQILKSFNSCRAELIWEKISLYLLSILNKEMAQIAEILPRSRQGPIHPA